MRTCVNCPELFSTPSNDTNVCYLAARLWCIFPQKKVASRSFSHVKMFGKMKEKGVKDKVEKSYLKPLSMNK